MSVASLALSASEQNREQRPSVVEKLIETWLVLCEEYRQRERRELIEHEAPQAKVHKFRDELKWLLRSARLLQSLAADPDYPAAQHAEQIGWRLRQLEDSWKGLDNSLSEAEANALLRKHFPDDPLTAKLLQG